MSARTILKHVYNNGGMTYEQYQKIDRNLKERTHGTWVDVPKYPGFYVCSNCLKKLDGDFERFDHWEMKKENFCSVCGSDNRKMGDKE